jgi:hypothetical protein
MKKVINFRRKNRISCINVPMRTLMWEYICWVLAGKPEKSESNSMSYERYL